MPQPFPLNTRQRLTHGLAPAQNSQQDRQIESGCKPPFQFKKGTKVAPEKMMETLVTMMALQIP